MTTFRAHQKQFILGPKPVSVWPDWTIVNVGEGLVLSVCPKLGATRLQSRDGVAYCLLGFAVLADQPMKTIAEVFPSKDSSEIEDWTGFWSGKWALISAERVWPDASGCLGIYHRKVGGAVWISSSPALLGDHVPDAPSEPYIAWQVRHRNGMDWIPAPFTTRENVYKVMALRTINPVSGAIRPVRFSAAEADANIDAQTLASAMKTIMINWARAGFRDHYLSLTAGMDSRLILAAASAAGLKVEARTINYPEASKADLALPPRLAAIAGMPHKLIRRPNPPLPLSEIMSRSAAIVEHMDGATFHPVSATFAHGLDDFMHDAGRTMTGGQMFGLGRCVYFRRFGNAGLGAARPSPDQVLDAYFTHSYDSYPFWNTHPRARWREAMQAWLDSLSEPRALKLDWREAFHLDQAIGGWCSGMLRLLDIHDGNYFPPANCIWILHLLVRDPLEKKKDAVVHRDAIRLLSPALAELPTNPPTRIALVKRAVKRMLGDHGTQTLKSQLRRFKLR